ncbi:hypothetical protein V2J09_023618 [Rumex salicifolius]
MAEQPDKDLTESSSSEEEHPLPDFELAKRGGSTPDKDMTESSSSNEEHPLPDFELPKRGGSTPDKDLTESSSSKEEHPLPDFELAKHGGSTPDKDMTESSSSKEEHPLPDFELPKRGGSTPDKDLTESSSSEEERPLPDFDMPERGGYTPDKDLTESSSSEEERPLPDFDMPERGGYTPDEDFTEFSSSDGRSLPDFDMPSRGGSTSEMAEQTESAFAESSKEEPAVDAIDKPADSTSTSMKFWSPFFDRLYEEPVLVTRDQLSTDRYPSKVQQNITESEIVDQIRVDTLFAKLSSSSIPDKKSAAKQLLTISKQPQNQFLFTNRTEVLAMILTSLNLEVIDPELHVDIATLIHRLSTRGNAASREVYICEHPAVLYFLVESLRCGPTDARAHAAAGLGRVASFVWNKDVIVETGAIKALSELLRETKHPETIKCVLLALLEICVIKKIREKARVEELHLIALHKLQDPDLEEFEDDLVAILALFLQNRPAMEDLVKPEIANVLLPIFTDKGTHHRTRENAMMVLCETCALDTDGTLLELIRANESVEEDLEDIVKFDISNPGARGEAKRLLEMMQGFESSSR